MSPIVKSCELPAVQRVQHQRFHFGYDLRVILIGFGLRAIFGNSLAERVLQHGGGEWNSGPRVGRNRESFRHIVSGEKVPVNLFWIDGLDHRGFVVRGVAAVFSENLTGDVVGQNPPVDDERVDFIFQRDVLRELLQDGNLWAVAVEDDDVLETVVNQSHQHRADVDAERFFGNTQATGIRSENIGDAVGNVRGNERVDVGGDGVSDAEGHGVVGAVVDEAVGFQRADSEDNRFNFGGDELAKFLPV